MTPNSQPESAEKKLDKEPWSATEGAPVPLGVTYIAAENGKDAGWNFALYSQHATGVTLLLYDDDVTKPSSKYPFELPRNKTNYVWHCRLAIPESIKYYGYSVDGPLDPSHGDRFDKEKVLLDPFASSVYFPPAFNRDAASRPGPNEGKAPLGVLPREKSRFDWGDNEQRPRHDTDTIIYEMHVKGFTARENSEVSADTRGTYLGVIQKIPHLKELGVTVVELMPVFPGDPDSGNYWNYASVNFFSPQQSYATKGGNAAEEFREMVKALHNNGIEVVLDVVYNHTAELGEGRPNYPAGPNYSFRGIDNSTYYLLNPKDMTQYADYSGTGNSLQCANPEVRKLILESMRFWVQEMHVDGFRFDLAPIFARNGDGTLNPCPPLIAAINTDAAFEKTRLFAEAWDSGVVQLGREFPGTTWCQWNGNFRDEVRQFVKGDPGMVQPLMKGLYGSKDVFNDGDDRAYKPFQSINYICCHDGFTLRDLVSYNSKHNEANGENNSDGEKNNHSWNCGNPGDNAEGDDNLSRYPYLARRRKQQIKNFCTLLFLANGTPMIFSGDEFGHTQQGNNNPYNQDNNTSYVDWSLKETYKDIFRFFQKMIAFRKKHCSIARRTYWGEDVTWYLHGVTGEGLTGDPELPRTTHTLAYCLHGSAVNDQDLYVMINAYWNKVDFVVQEGKAEEWRKVIDTAAPTSGDDIIDDPYASNVAPIDSLWCSVQARSIVVLVRDTEGSADSAHVTSTATGPAVANPFPPREENAPSQQNVF